MYTLVRRSEKENKALSSNAPPTIVSQIKYESLINISHVQANFYSLSLHEHDPTSDPVSTYVKITESIERKHSLVTSEENKAGKSFLFQIRGSVRVRRYGRSRDAAIDLSNKKKSLGSWQLRADDWSSSWTPGMAGTTGKTLLD